VYDVQIPIEEDYEGERRHLVLEGILALLPEQEENHKKRIVVFAHVSGSILR
jgi:hypothetical protein